MDQTDSTTMNCVFNDTELGGILENVMQEVEPQNPKGIQQLKSCIIKVFSGWSSNEVSNIEVLGTLFGLVREDVVGTKKTRNAVKVIMRLLNEQNCLIDATVNTELAPTILSLLGYKQTGLTILAQAQQLPVERLSADIPSGQELAAALLFVENTNTPGATGLVPLIRVLFPNWSIREEDDSNIFFDLESTDKKNLLGCLLKLVVENSTDFPQNFRITKKIKAAAARVIKLLGIDTQIDSDMKSYILGVFASNVPDVSSEAFEQAPVPRTVEELSVINEQRNQLASIISAGDSEKLAELGFDPSLLPVMQFWLENGPTVLGTYSHPTEFDLYKIVASWILTKTCNIIGIPQNQITVLQLDTRDEGQSSQRPLGVAEFGPVKKQDPLSVTTNVFDYENAIVGTVTQLISQMQNEIFAVIDLLVKSGLKPEDNFKIIKEDIMAQIEKTLRSRLRQMLEIKPDYVQCNDETSLQVGMTKFNLAMARIVLEGFSDEDNVEQIVTNTGTKTLSEASEYRAFISLVLEKLLQIKGVDILKKLVKPGEGLLKLTTEEGVVTLSVNKDQNFVLIDQSKIQFSIVEPEDVITLINTGLPLGKLEELAIMAGAQAIHCGSTHGAEVTAIDALSIAGEAKKYLLQLRFGPDGTQGHEGLKLKKQLVPLPLQFLMLGAKGVQTLIVAGQQNFEDIEQLRRFFAQSLVREALQLSDLEQ